MRTIETTATVNEEGQLTVQVPREIPPGEHRVVVVIEERLADKREQLPDDFPVIHVGSWPADLSLRREDMYDE